MCFSERSFRIVLSINGKGPNVTSLETRVIDTLAWIKYLYDVEAPRGTYVQTGNFVHCLMNILHATLKKSTQWGLEPPCAGLLSTLVSTAVSCPGFQDQGNPWKIQFSIKNNRKCRKGPHLKPLCLGSQQAVHGPWNYSYVVFQSWGPTALYLHMGSQC